MHSLWLSIDRMARAERRSSSCKVGVGLPLASNSCFPLKSSLEKFLSSMISADTAAVILTLNFAGITLSWCNDVSYANVQQYLDFNWSMVDT